MRRSRERRFWLIVVVLAIALAACRGDDAAPPATVTASAESESVPTVAPERTLASPATPTSSASDGAPAQQGEPPSAETSSDPTQADPGGVPLALIEPADGAETTAGAPLTARGTANAGDRVRVVLVQQVSDSVLAEAETAAAGAWALDITPPDDLVGPLLLRVELQSGDGAVLADESATVLSVPPSDASTAIRIIEPPPGSAIASGRQFSLFGNARFVGETGNVTLRLLADACTTVAATISFNMVGSGAWEGFMGVPPNVSGPVCAVAIIGPPDSADARSAYVPLTVVPPDS